MADGFLSRTAEAIKTPSSGMTWPQLAAATVFVVVVLIAWRQVVRFILNEVE